VIVTLPGRVCRHLVAHPGVDCDLHGMCMYCPTCGARWCDTLPWPLPWLRRRDPRVPLPFTGHDACHCHPDHREVPCALCDLCDVLVAWDRVPD
jgi:hypothetical protein